MNNFIRKEIDEIKKNKLRHALRLFLDVFSMLLIVQWVYSGVSSLNQFGELKVTWVDDWFFSAATIIWLILLSYLFFLSALYKDELL